MQTEKLTQRYKLTFVICRHDLDLTTKAWSALIHFCLKTNTFRCVQALFRPHLYAKRFHRKRINLKTPLKVDQNDRISVDGRKQWKTDQIYMKTMNENIAGACVYSMRIEFNLRHKMHIPIVCRRFFVNSHKKSQNGSGEANRSICFRCQ